MRGVLKDALASSGATDHVELRFHAKTFHGITVRDGRLERATVRHRDGVGVRVLAGGTWGFASTGEVEVRAIRAAIERARAAALCSASLRQHHIPALPAANMGVGEFLGVGVTEARGRSIDERVALAVRLEAHARGAGARIHAASATYNEIQTTKAIVTSDGADAQLEFVQPELVLGAIAQQDGELQQVHESIGVTGGWSCLFRTPGEVLAERAARTATDLLSAKVAPGGRATVILSPALVGLLVHEAVGHTVEADFVQSGSVAAGKLGQRVASDLVTLCDSGASEHTTGAGGTIPVDDEGVLTQKTVIIERGVLKSYLHSRESAAHFGVAPTGNARAWEYADQPLIRMRNTYIEPGGSSLAEMIASTRDGFLLDGARNGQADATGEFMFGTTSARRIRNGKLAELVRGVTVTGNAFDVLRSVDAVSREFEWALGSGHCGKGQPAKVDAGGPYLRCRAILGGTQATQE